MQYKYFSFYILDKRRKKIVKTISHCFNEILFSIIFDYTNSTYKRSKKNSM